MKAVVITGAGAGAGAGGMVRAGGGERNVLGGDKGRRVEVAGEMWADTEDFVGLFYPNPDGTICHCLNSKLAHAEVTLRIEGRPPRTLRSERAALEIGTRDPNHGVRMYV